MKKILVILFILTGFISQAQISDAKIGDTIALWIVPNLTKSITAAQMNAILDHLNNSKINKDSIVAVRTNAAEDSLFIKYKTTLDTIVLLHELDNLSDVTLTTPDASDILMLDDETQQWVNRPLSVLAGLLYDSTGLDTSKWVETGNYLYPKNLPDSVGIGTETPIERFDVQNGNINLDTTSATSGQIKQNGLAVFHTFTPDPLYPNIYIGEYSGGWSATSAGLNIGIGKSTLQNLSSEDYNIAIGTYSQERMRGDYNVGVGGYTLQGSGTPANNIGYKNVAVGHSTLTQITSGNENTIVGSASGQGITTGSYNVACGAGIAIATTGSKNVAIGYGALNGNTANIESVAVGHQAMGKADTRSTGRTTYNTAVGYRAMYGSATAANNTGQYNTAVGYQALDAMTSGAYNTVIGVNAGGVTTTGSNNIYLGYNTGNAASYATLSDKLVIDNTNGDSTAVLIFGNFATDKLTFNVDELYLNPIPDEATKVGRIAHINQYGKIEWVSPLKLYEEQLDTLKDTGSGTALPDPDSIYYALLDTAYTNIDSLSVTSLRSPDGYLPNWRKDFAKSLYGEMTITDDNAKLAVIGDSYGLSIHPYLTKYAQYMYGYGGGYQPFVASAIASSGVYCNIGANWADSVDVTDTLILNSYYVESSTAGATIMISVPYFNKLRVFYKQVSGGGTFSYQLGASGTPTNISTDGATAAKWCYKNFAALKSNPTDTVIIKVVSGAVRLYGFYFQNDYNVQIFNEPTQKLEVHNLAIGGTTVSQFVGKNATAVNTLIDTLDISAFIMIWLDLDAELPYTNYPTLITNLRSAKATTDYLILTPYNNYTSLGTSQSRKYRALSKTLNVGYMDMSNLTGQYSNNDAAGLMTDLTHFNSFGASLLYLELAKVLFQPTSRFGSMETTNLKINTNSIQFPNSNSIYISRKDRSEKVLNYNTVLGYDAANALTTGYSTTAIGHLALEANTTGYQNTAVGKDALNDNLDGNDNTAVGMTSGSKNTSGIANLYLGRNAGGANLTGSYNAIGGAYAYETATDKNYNTIYGSLSGRYSVGDENTYIGFIAGSGVSGQSNSGKYNTYVGAYCGKNTVTAYRNTAVGFQAMQGKSSSSWISTGYGNVSVGYQNLYNINTGGLNTSIGYQAGFSNATGSSNIFLGRGSGYNETGSSKFYVASDSTGSNFGTRTDSKLLMYGDMSNADKANHTLAVYANTTIYDDLNYGDTYYRDATVSALSLAGGVQSPTLQAVKGGIYGQGFNHQTANDIAYGQIQLNHDYKLATDIEAHCHWSITTSPAPGSDTVVVAFEYSWADIDEAWPTSDTAIIKIPTYSASGGGYHRLTELVSAITGAGGDGLSSAIIFRIERLQDNPSDTYAGWWILHDVDFHIQIDSPGSDSDTTK